MHSDSDLTKKTKKTCEKVSENLYILGNEPSLACFRIQEHCHKSVPQLVDKMIEMKKIQNRLKGNFYDLEYSISAIKSMYGTESHFQNIQELLKNSLFLKQQLDYEENVRMRVSAMSSTGSASGPINAPNRRTFQRFSGSFDLPASLIPSSIMSVTSSASADLKDLRSVISQMATPPSVAKRNRTSSLSSASSKRHSEVPQTNSGSIGAEPTPPSKQESNDSND